MLRQTELPLAWLKRLGSMLRLALFTFRQAGQLDRTARDNKEETKMTLKWSALVAAALGFALTGAEAQAQTKLKWAHVYETSEPFHTQSVWAAQELAKRTNNRYQVDVYPASQLGKETDLNQGPSPGSGGRIA